jgi:hypothetical protein
MLTALGDAVVSAVNASGLLDSGEAAARRVIPKFDLEDTQTRQIQVITPGIDRTRQNRAEFRNLHLVQIGVLVQLPSKDPDDVDPQIALVEDLLNLRFDPVTDGGETAYYFDSTAAPIYDADKLEELHQFVGVVTVRFAHFQEA